MSFGSDHPGLTAYIIIQVIWAVLIWAYLTHMLKKKIHYVYEYANKQVDKRFRPYQRQEIDDWPLIQLYIGAATLLPLRLAYFISSLVIMRIIILCMCSHTIKSDKEEKGRRPIISFVMYLVSRSILFICCGVWWLHPIQEKIKEYEKTYPDYSSKVEKPSLIISNHVSWFDGLIIHSLENVSGVGKSDVKKFPLFGAIFNSLQYLFVDRKAKDGKHKAVEDILTRCDNIAKHLSFNPIMIFPEGTTTNGKYVVEFKKGPFLPKKPIKIYAIQFDTTHFNPFMDEIPEVLLMMLTLSKLRNSIQVYEFDTYYPDHLNLGNDDWEVYAEATKKIVTGCLGKHHGCISSEANFIDQLDYRELQGLEVPEHLKIKKRKSIQKRQSRASLKGSKQKIDIENALSREKLNSEEQQKESARKTTKDENIELLAKSQDKQ